MHSGLRALLAGVVDYAGLFPPARLPLEQAVRNYDRYRQGPDAWMLGRFVMPAARFAELEPFQAELFRPGEPFLFSALGRGGDDLAPFREGFGADLNALAAFYARHQDRVRIDALEVRLPPAASVPQRQDDALDLLNSMTAALDRVFPVALGLFCEMTPGPDWESSLWAVVGLLAAYNEQPAVKGRRCCPAGFKLRTGGLEADAFPPPERVARAIKACRDAGVLMKFTAGLHHPLRRFDPGVGAAMHGFVNVFVAGVLAVARRLSAGELQPLLEDEDAKDFAFDDGGLGWKGVRASTAEVAAARREAVLSFGSCSFDEPRDDLRALGWL